MSLNILIIYMCTLKEIVIFIRKSEAIFIQNIIFFLKLKKFEG